MVASATEAMAKVDPQTEERRRRSCWKEQEEKGGGEEKKIGRIFLPLIRKSSGKMGESKGRSDNKRKDLCRIFAASIGVLKIAKSLAVLHDITHASLP